MFHSIAVTRNIFTYYTEQEQHEVLQVLPFQKMHTAFLQSLFIPKLQIYCFSSDSAFLISSNCLTYVLPSKGYPDIFSRQFASYMIPICQLTLRNHQQAWRVSYFPALYQHSYSVFQYRSILFSSFSSNLSSNRFQRDFKYLDYVSHNTLKALHTIICNRHVAGAQKKAHIQSKMASMALISIVGAQWESDLQQLKMLN